MSYTYELDYSLWEAYLADCLVNKVTPSVKDYTVWLEEADMDRRENWELES